MFRLLLPFDGQYLLRQKFGEHISYYLPQGYALGHPGLDWVLPIGTRVLAAARGIATLGGVDPRFPGRGIHVWLDHENGYRTLYAHLDRADALPDMMLHAGEQVGLSGYSGLVVPAGPAGAHLHFGLEEIARRGDDMRGFIDPWSYIAM